MIENNPQFSSPLLSLLPAEIRHEIWTHLFSNLSIPLVLENGRLKIRGPLKENKLFSLPLACRQTYNETHHLIFSRKTTFYTKNEHVVLALPPSLLPRIKNLHFIFPLYARAVPDFSVINRNNEEKGNGTREMGPNERAWVVVWERLREMRGLKRLYVEFEVPGVWKGIWAREGNERGLRESLRGVGAESFVVGLPWEREDRRGVGMGMEMENEEVEVESEGEIEIVRVGGKTERERPRRNSFASGGAMIWRREKCFRLEL